MRTTAVSFGAVDISRSYTSYSEVISAGLAAADQLVSTAASRLGRERMQRIRRDIVYVLHPTKNGRRVLLNRAYKPCGFANRSVFVDYEDFSAHLVALSDAEVASLVAPGRTMALFDDGSAPWLSRASARSYRSRLQRVADLLESRGR